MIYAPFAGGYESTILKMGFVDAQGVVPGTDVKQFMVLAFYLFDLICATVYLILHSEIARCPGSTRSF